MRAFGTSDWLTMSNRDKLQELASMLPEAESKELLSLFRIQQETTAACLAMIDFANRAMSPANQAAPMLVQFATGCFFHLKKKADSILEDAIREDYNLIVEFVNEAARGSTIDCPPPVSNFKRISESETVNENYIVSVELIDDDLLRLGLVGGGSLDVESQEAVKYFKDKFALEDSDGL